MSPSLYVRVRVCTCACFLIFAEIQSSIFHPCVHTYACVLICAQKSHAAYLCVFFDMRTEQPCSTLMRESWYGQTYFCLHEASMSRPYKSQPKQRPTAILPLFWSTDVQALSRRKSARVKNESWMTVYFANGCRQNERDGRNMRIEICEWKKYANGGNITGKEHLELRFSVRRVKMCWCNVKFASCKNVFMQCEVSRIKILNCVVSKCVDAMWIISTERFSTALCENVFMRCEVSRIKVLNCVVPKCVDAMWSISN